MLGTLNTIEIEEVLANHYVGHLGCHADDVTYVVPISYVYDGQYIFGHTEEGMKITMMRKNPKVCFELEDLEDLSNWKSVIAWGEYEELNTAAERQQALDLLYTRPLPYIFGKTSRFSPQWPFAPNDKTNIKGIVYRIKLKEKTGRFERAEGVLFSA